MKLDAHQHFWSYNEAEYPWIPLGSPLQRDWLPQDFAVVQRPLGFDGSIAVQARQSLAETHWLLGLADADPRIFGVVGWVDLQAEDIAAQLETLARHPRLVGVRHVIQDEPDADFMRRPTFLRGLAQLQRFRLTYDLLIYPHQLPAALAVVRQFPEQRFVLDHGAKPLIRAGTLSPWREQIRELAAFQNVSCKVSGLVTEADLTHWKPTDLRPYLEILAEAFDVRRLLFGSDWPVCLLAAEYEAVEGVVRDFFRGLDPQDQARLWGGNCAQIYLNR